MITGAEYDILYHYDVIFVDVHKMALIEGDIVPMALHGEQFQCKIPFGGNIYINKQPPRNFIYLYAYNLKDMPCLGWFDGTQWFYHFCPKTGITQIHLTRKNYSLGSKFSNYFAKRKVNNFYGSKNSYYFVRNYTDGDKCELTNKHRSAVVKFVCDPFGKDRVAFISEIYTCEYVAIVKTNRVCLLEDIAGIPIFCGSKVDAKRQILRKFQSLWDSIVQKKSLPDTTKDKKSMSGETKYSSEFLSYFYYAEDIMLAKFLEEDDSIEADEYLIDLLSIFPIAKNSLNLTSVTTFRNYLNFKEVMGFHMDLLVIFNYLKEVKNNKKVKKYLDPTK